jgi:scyllo-inositol 2-dehydrogenase (NAD+)
MSKVGIAVVGAGTLGKRHAENVRAIPGARLTAVVDSDLNRAKEVAAELGVELAAGCFEQIAGREDIHAVVIASPSKFHAEQIQAAARMGKHVFCEKPIALCLADALAASEVVSKAGVLLQIGFMRRYDPAYSETKRRIESGAIGDPIMFKSLGRDRQPPPAAFYQGGVNGTLFSDSAIHDFDLARWLMNDEIVEVHTFAGLLASPELAEFGDIDACLVNLRFGRGGIGNVESFRKSHYGYDIRTEIIGTKGTIQTGYLQHTASLTLTATGSWFERVDHWLVRFADAYRLELADFVYAIQKGGPTRVTGEDGVRALAAALAAERSFREGQAAAVAAPASCKA